MEAATYSVSGDGLKETTFTPLLSTLTAVSKLLF
jgi:hypothetical protein